MIQDPVQQRQLQAQVQQSPVQRGRVNEERFVSEVAGGHSVKPSYSQWQQFSGGPLDAQFVPSVDDPGASLMKPGMFVKKLGDDVTGNNIDRLGEYRRPNGTVGDKGRERGPDQVQNQQTSVDVVEAGREFQLRDVSTGDVQKTNQASTGNQRQSSVILAALAPLS